MAFHDENIKLHIHLILQMGTPKSEHHYYALTVVKLTYQLKIATKIPLNHYNQQ